MASFHPRHVERGAEACHLGVELGDLLPVLEILRGVSRGVPVRRKNALGALDRTLARVLELALERSCFVLKRRDLSLGLPIFSYQYFEYRYTGRQCFRS